MSSDKTFGVRLALEKGKVRVESDNPDLGAAQGRDRRRVQGDAGRRSASTPATSSTCSAEIETPEVRVELSGELDPAVVRPADGSDYVCVVMPMRL